MKKYISEFVGTMMLVLLACGVAVVVGCSTPAGIIATALAFGLVIVAMAYSIGNVSGCHINPAVSISMVVAGKMEVKECVKYVISQFLGALAGAAILGLLLGSFDMLGANGFGSLLPNGTEVTWYIALIVEIILTFVFVTAILGVTDKKENGHATGIVIGLTLTLVHLFGIPFTGTSVNPARSFGPALLQCGKALSQVWVFIVAPIIGCVLAGLFYKFVLKSSKK
ncbi:MAG: MIP family channel protein [Bacilli bacterium]|nr:MIP family channel protein [Bacilli bacterium]